MSGLELWAGPECTVNRVGDVYRDQLEETGFAARLDDIDRLASVGVRRVRLPLLWERLDQAGDTGWQWAQQRVERLRELGIGCIAGLLHHGSGPAPVNLLHPEFAERLARHAFDVASRFPGIGDYTPVNEPLTTARFSGLYGVWHPHACNDTDFVRMLLNQVDGVRRSMNAVRMLNPAARLVQTEDLGFTHATPELQYQAVFENQRRWLTFDLLFGRVDRHHPLWRYLLRHGAGEHELMSWVEQPCAPDLVGINHYVTSQRFLDDRTSHYPEAMHGGNRRHRYVDVETVRVHGAQLDGVQARLEEAWRRYGTPVALTESHLGCTREEQMRWFHQCWLAAQNARRAGADVKAVTAWAAFGTWDWNSLVTRRDGRYEAGLWDVRAAQPRTTALAELARQVARGEAPDHPVLEGAGWWQRAMRHLYPTHGAEHCLPMRGRPLLIVGGHGTLARGFAHLCHLRGLPYRLLSRAELDIADEDSVQVAFDRWQPWALVNAAGYVRVDDAEHDPRQWRDNVDGPRLLARQCARHGVRFVTYSSDLVFDGRKPAPYVESDLPRPLNAYGRAKAHAERCVLWMNPEALVVRTAAFFGPWDRHNFVTRGLNALRRGERWQACPACVVSPTYVRDLVMSSLDLLIDGETGIWHLANRGALSWHEFATLAAQAAGLDATLIDAVSPAGAAARPHRVVLDSERGQLMPSLDDALSRYLAEAGADVLPASDEEPLLHAARNVGG